MDRGRNITTDNFFISIPLAQKLFARKNDCGKTTRKGLVKQTRTTKTSKGKNDNITFFYSDLYQSENQRRIIFIVYKSKPNHKRLPESISYYNKTKLGMDILQYVYIRFDSNEHMDTI